MHLVNIPSSINNFTILFGFKKAIRSGDVGYFKRRFRPKPFPAAMLPKCNW